MLEQGDRHLNWTVILRKGETRTWKQPPTPRHERRPVMAGSVLSGQQSQGEGLRQSPPSVLQSSAQLIPQPQASGT